eukprot:tig00021582_g22632.t1
MAAPVLRSAGHLQGAQLAHRLHDLIQGKVACGHRLGAAASVALLLRSPAHPAPSSLGAAAQASGDLARSRGQRALVSRATASARAPRRTHVEAAHAGPPSHEAESEEHVLCSEDYLPASRRGAAVARGPAASDSSSSGTTADTDPMHSDLALWRTIRQEAKADAQSEPILASFLYSAILVHTNLEDCLAFTLANKLQSPTLLSTQLLELFKEVIAADRDLRQAFLADLRAVRARDPACRGFSQALLYFKGFQAVQAYRVSHALWRSGRVPLALALQSRISEVFHVDVHPAARIGRGILLDHATGVVIGETSVVGNDVSILHGVTLGGTGKESGDRHPKIGNGVLLAAGVAVLGNIRIGDGAKIGAGSVVVKDIPPHVTACGVPAKVLGKAHGVPGETMDQTVN